MNKELQTIKELIAEMKAQFSKSVEKFEQATLADGTTVIEYEALEVGMPVFVVADGEMTGHSEFFNADGVGTQEHIISSQPTQIAHKKGVGKRRVDGGNILRHLRFHGGFIWLD